MKNIDNFTIEKHNCSYENRPLKSKLYFDNKDLNLKLPGYIIEKQFELKEYFLLFISWECPFEEACEVALLSKEFKLLEIYSFSTQYESYFLEDVLELSKDTYKVIFNKSVFFELSINYPSKHIFNKYIKVNKIIS